MIQVAHIDDHQLFSEGIKSLFKEMVGMRLIASYEDCDLFLKGINEQWPDVILLDINLEKSNGIEVCQKLKKLNPAVKIIALTMSNKRNVIRAMINAGADGYLLKNTSKNELSEAIKKVMTGEVYIGGHAAKIFTEDSFRSAFTKEAKAQNFSITRREKEVLALIISEKTTSEISKELGIAFTTVETHRKNLLTKLGVRNIAGLVRVAIEENLI